ncbi:hypothetical protein P154DRAFT_614566 [Amniculicola lignicola CBS 123094]|uniref:Uncharacterized protein n=1 Tax=Amniculicola lignicola CBS 123094 TaxID=1392246 RepID=A0A6A5X5P0_9PLEO|nr:hypothetical protein P154DRAFT_614566 [Amniculicola lignicola CBS 123094]
MSNSHQQPPPPPFAGPRSIYLIPPPDEPPPSYDDATQSSFAPLLTGPPPPSYGTYAYPEPAASSTASSDDADSSRVLPEWVGQALVVICFLCIIITAFAAQELEFIVRLCRWDREEDHINGNDNVESHFQDLDGTQHRAAEIVRW